MPRAKFAILVVVPLAAFSIWVDQQKSQAFFETQSLYTDIRVEKRGDYFNLRMNEGIGIHSTYNPASFWTGSYWDSMAMIPVLLGAKDVTILGVAGGSIPRVIKHIDPSIHITGVEIDPELTEIARMFFGSSLTGVNIVHEDGRSYISRNQDQTDIMIMDAFGHDSYIPFHLATKEFFQAAKDHVHKGGVIAVNIPSISEDTHLFRGVVSTMQSVFSHTQYVKIERTGNFILLASDEPLDLGVVEFSEPKAVQISTYLQENIQEAEPIGTRVLTDNRSPIEFLTDSIIFSYL